ncbi:sugar ABC transporter substrate-binding protein [Alicyclobacillus kakegawensis]|uniref:sugar ABC transporter substrate-binding protein n=1 Tax=Alicyclobacillus kakegawensis TaxID=392012 RepID=UPI0008296B5C|nr:sugar ABC transporter substrate-binding protein [Alicyclobacillus kakegawensis]
MKKLAIILSSMVAVSIALVSGCGATTSGNDAGNQSTSSSSSNAHATNKTPVIGVTVSSLSNPYIKPYATALQNVAKKYGVKLIILDGQNSVIRQANEIQDLITKGVDGIIVNPVDQEGVIPAIKAAHNAGIPVDTGNMNVAADGLRYISAFTGPDDVTQAEQAASLMVKALHQKGQVGIIIGMPGDSASVNRLKGFKKEFSKYPGIKIVGTAIGNWQKSDSLTAAQNLLTAHPGLNGIICVDDNSAAGAIEALQQSGKAGKVTVVGIGDNSTGAANIKAGLQYGTTDQSPVTDATYAIKVMLEVINHQSHKKLNYIPTPVVTKDNIDKYPPQW